MDQLGRQRFLRKRHRLPHQDGGTAVIVPQRAPLGSTGRVSSEQSWPLRGSEGTTFADRCPAGQTYAERRDALLKSKGLK